MSGREATVRVRPDAPAETVAAAVRPDDTEEMTTRTQDGAVVCTIRREATGGLRSTVDDYVVNLQVATEVAQLADRHDTPNHE